MITEKDVLDCINQQYKSLKQFAEEVDIPYTTLYTALNRNKGLGNMRVDLALKIFQKLGLDPNYLYEDPTMDLSDDEDDLLTNYRKLSYYNQQTLIMLAKRMVYGVELATSGVEVMVYNNTASAGNGSFLDSDDYELVAIPESYVPRETTFGIKVSGKSMEPDYPDGSIVFVKRVKDIQPGEVGIFIKNNEGFIKEAGEGKLISINPNYDDVEIQEFEDCRVVGKVVGCYEREE